MPPPDREPVRTDHHLPARADQHALATAGEALADACDLLADTPLEDAAAQAAWEAVQQAFASWVALEHDPPPGTLELDAAAWEASLSVAADLLVDAAPLAASLLSEAAARARHWMTVVQ